MTEGDTMLNVFEIRYAAIQDQFRVDANIYRYQDELRLLKRDIGRIMDDDDSVLRWIYRRVAQELSFITQSKPERETA